MKEKLKMNSERVYQRGMVFFANINEDKKGLTRSVQVGRKPVVITQNDIGNKYSPTVIVSVLTSRVGSKTNLPTHVLLKKENNKFLTSDSLIMTEQTLTIDKRDLDGYFGMISEEDINAMDKALLISMGLHTKEVANNKLTEINITEKIITRWIAKGKSLMALEDTIKDLNVLVRDYRNYCARFNIKDEYKEKYLDMVEQYNMGVKLAV